MINILVSHLPRLGELPVRAKDNRELDVEGCNGGRRVVLWIETAHREPDKCYDESVCLARGQVLGTAIVWKLVARGNRHTIARIIEGSRSQSSSVERNSPRSRRPS